MEVQSIKSDLHRMIDNITDVHFLNALKEILKKGEQASVMGYTTDGKPLTKEDYIAQIREAQKRVKAGQYTSVEDLEKDSEKW